MTEKERLVECQEGQGRRSAESHAVNRSRMDTDRNVPPGFSRWGQLVIVTVGQGDGSVDDGGS